MSGMHPGTREYRNQSVRLADLTVTTDEIVDIQFENCTVYGPAVLVPLGTTFNNCTWIGDTEAILWPVPVDRARVIGVIGLVRCTFYNCRMERLGIVVPEPEIDQIRRSFEGD